MSGKSGLKPKERDGIDKIIREHGYTDYKWMDPKSIVVSQWVRMKCTFGCGEFGHCACCPPNVPPVEECRRFFHEYSDALIFRFSKKVDKPEDRFAWTRKVNLRLLKLEREVFLSGQERTFLLFMDSCSICEECAGERNQCRSPRMARPAPEAMAVDVYTTVRENGFPIAVLPDYDREMNRYAFLMVR